MRVLHHDSSYIIELKEQISLISKMVTFLAQTLTKPIIQKEKKQTIFKEKIKQIAYTFNGRHVASTVVLLGGKPSLGKKKVSQKFT